MNKNDLFLIIDGNSLLYRSFYGTYYGKKILSTSYNFPTNAIFTFYKTFIKLIDKYNPTHLFIAFDAGKTTIRHKKMLDYKANRQKTPNELLIQIPIVKHMLKILNVKNLELVDYEADDIIASLTHEHPNIKKIVFSSDRDLLQLVNENTSILMPKNEGQFDFINLSNFSEKFMFLPSQAIDFKAIVGDPSDNLPGVKGIGPKGAIELLKNFNNLENIYQNLESITPSISQKLFDNKKNAFFTKEMSTLINDLNLKIDLSEIAFTKIMNNELIDFFSKYELMTLIPKKNEQTEKKEDKFAKIIF